MCSRRVNKSSMELFSVDKETRVIRVRALIDRSFLELICEEQAPEKDLMKIDDLMRILKNEAGLATCRPVMTKYIPVVD